MQVWESLRRAQRAFGNADVVLRSPQSLIPSSGGTTFLGHNGPSTSRTWCPAPRKPLFFRRRAPRLSDPAGLRRAGRGASLPALPYSVVRGHHVHEIQQAFGEPDVVLHRPQTLIPSSTGTTSPGSSGPPASRTWCFTPYNPLFLRPGAPRPRDPAGLRRTGRGASLPASPYSFITGHHVPRAHRVPMLKTKAEGNSRPRISLPLMVGGNFPLFPTAPSPLGAAPIGKHFRPASFPEVLPIPNPEAHSIRPGLNGLSSPQNRNGNASRSGSAALLFHHNRCHP